MYPRRVGGNYRIEFYRVIRKILNSKFGITIWGVGDLDSWLYENGTDFPLLYNTNYAKKAAYASVMQALKQ